MTRLASTTCALACRSFLRSIAPHIPMSTTCMMCKRFEDGHLSKVLDVWKLVSNLWHVLESYHFAPSSIGVCLNDRRCGCCGCYHHHWIDRRSPGPFRKLLELSL